MPKTITPPPGDSDKGFEVSRGNPDGTVTLYYPGETPPPLPPSPPSVPDEVPARLALRLLLRDQWFGPAVTTPAQLNAAVEAFLAQSVSDLAARNAALLDWQRSAVFQFRNPTIRSALPALGKTLADLAALMTEADEIRRQEEAGA